MPTRRLPWSALPLPGRPARRLRYWSAPLRGSVRRQPTAAAPTIEDLVREEMRPLLKEWLDTHLPPLVERLVRAEIERLVNRTNP